MAFVAVPFVTLLGAYVWQLIPDRTLSIRLERYRIFCSSSRFLPLGLAAGPLVGAARRTDLLFRGDLRAWLAWNPGGEADHPAYASTVGGWMLHAGPRCPRHDRRLRRPRGSRRRPSSGSAPNWEQPKLRSRPTSSKFALGRSEPPWGSHCLLVLSWGSTQPASTPVGA